MKIDNLYGTLVIVFFSIKENLKGPIFIYMYLYNCGNINVFIHGACI